MLTSGAADRIVRSIVALLGERRAPEALVLSGYVLGIPVFFDTVFYLLLPLARSLSRRVGGRYLLYVLAISVGAIASLLKIAQGSSTVAMIGASAVLGALQPNARMLGFHPAYLGTAIGWRGFTTP